MLLCWFFFQAEDGIRYLVRSRGLGDVYKRQVKEYKIDYHYIDAFLRSMEMDLTNSYYEPQQYNEYIYGSAEVVGLMCLQIFAGNDDKPVSYTHLTLPTSDLV